MASKQYTIYTCDICGKEVKIAHSGCIEEWRYVGGDKTETPFPIDNDFDICDDCYEKIVAFVDVLKAEV